MGSYSPLELAQAYVRTAEWDFALEALAEYLQQHPSDQEARRLRVDILLRQSPASVWADLAQLDEQAAETWRLRALAHEQTGDLSQAITCLQTAHALAPHDAHLSERLLELYGRMGDYASALVLIGQQPPTWGWLARAGELHALRADYPAALSAYSQALTLLMQGVPSPYRASLAGRLYSARGQVHQHLQGWTEAEADYAQAQALLGADAGIQFNQGLLACLRGNLEQAHDLCQRAYDAANDALRAEMRRSLAGKAEYAVIHIEG